MPTHHRGSREECRALNAYIALLRAAESVGARLNRSLAATGLTPGQFGALEALHHLGPMCQRDLGAKLLRSGGNVTMVVDHLEKRGLVERKRSEEDRRYTRVQLTKPGAKLIRELFPKHVRAIVREMSVLPAVDLEKLRSICRTVGRAECGALAKR
jgi:MarR family 2-MHQ and catechol resistance regulon transcriptional repressor